MLIHSVTPPHMLIEQPSLPSLETRAIDGGYMEMYKTPQGLQMARLCSTDPSMYLRKEYSPGNMYSGR